MNRTAILALSFASFLIPVRWSSAAPGDLPVDVQSQVTWATAARPELHVLLRNTGKAPLSFGLRLGHIPGGEKIRCAEDLAKLDPDFSSRFSSWSGVSGGITRGAIPAEGWAHRSFLIGAGGGIPPCEVPYRLVLERDGELIDRVEGKFHVGKPEESARGDISEETLEWRAVVETDEVHEHRVLTRLLVRNLESHSVFLSVTDRRLRCVDGDSVAWALRSATVQGEDVGPFAIAPKGWAVFVAAVEAANGVKLEQCTASIQISADTDSGPRPVERVEFSLKPTGFYSGLHGAGEERSR